jgi:hypothetical protein
MAHCKKSIRTFTAKISGGDGSVYEDKRIQPTCDVMMEVGVCELGRIKIRLDGPSKSVLAKKCKPSGLRMQYTEPRITYF